MTRIFTVGIFSNPLSLETFLHFANSHPELEIVPPSNAPMTGSLEDAYIIHPDAKHRNALFREQIEKHAPVYRGLGKEIPLTTIQERLQAQELASTHFGEVRLDAPMCLATYEISEDTLPDLYVSLPISFELCTNPDFVHANGVPTLEANRIVLSRIANPQPTWINPLLSTHD